MDATKVSAGKPKIGGAIFCAPVGTPLPTDASTSLNEAFKDLGYASEDGVTNNNALESDTVKAWGGDTVLTLQTSKEDTFGFTLIETFNVEVLKAVYGDANVTGDLSTGIKVTVNSTDIDAKAWVIDMLLKGGVMKRIVIPNAKASELGEIVYSDSSAIGYPMTLNASPDTAGNTHYEYVQQPSV